MPCVKLVDVASVWSKSIIRVTFRCRKFSVQARIIYPNAHQTNINVVLDFSIQKITEDRHVILCVCCLKIQNCKLMRQYVDQAILLIMH
jgi:hypothetical protein